MVDTPSIRPISSEQQAVVLARSQGVMKRVELGTAMRSCYPEYARTRKEVYGAGMVDDSRLDDLDPAADPDEVDASAQFEDVEQFLAEYSLESSDEVIEEADAAEALAVSWKERRGDLNRLQKSRRFGDATRLRREFRVEVGELKKRTRCHKCNQVGHWSRERRSGKSSGKGKSKSSAMTGASGKGSASETCAAMVEHFAASASNDTTES